MMFLLTESEAYSRGYKLGAYLKCHPYILALGIIIFLIVFILFVRLVVKQIRIFNLK